MDNGLAALLVVMMDEYLVALKVYELAALLVVMMDVVSVA
jgi:hypothetical protein